MTDPTTDPTDIDVWTTTQGRWRLAVDEWLRRRRSPPESLSVDERPSGDDSGPTLAVVADAPPVDPPPPDEIDGNAATQGVTLDAPAVVSPTTEVLQ